MDIVVFYSWISDFKESNKKFIRKCIENALKQLERKRMSELEGVRLKLIESVRGEPGHVDIPSTQDRMIRDSDIFIGDWTIIDPYSKWESFKAKHLGFHRRRNANANVLHEYEVFVGSNGRDGAILVMDAFRGSAKANNEIIPFDLRSRRFPIEFAGFLEKSESELINDLFLALKDSVPRVIKNRKQRFLPFQTWYEQEECRSFHASPYYENEKLSSMKKRIKDSKVDLRILGLSGIGKTRLVHEAFRHEDDSFFRNNYLYAVYSEDDSNIIRSAALSHIKNPQDNCLLCIDNCPPRFAIDIQNAKAEYGASNRIITIYNRRDRDDNDKVLDVTYEYILLEDVASIVDDILKELYAQIPEEKKSVIKVFSAGLPMMAVIMANNAKIGYVNYARIPNSELIDKLLDLDNGEEKEILMSCALFSHIGYRNEVSHEAKFVITNEYLTPNLNCNECARMSLFERVLGKYISREIFETQGRFFAIRPIPLALHLAEEWLQGCNSDRILNVIRELSEDELRNKSQLAVAFSNQIAKLADSDKARELVAVISSPNSPLANEETLNTEFGSRLFSSFVEINPIAVADLLWRVFRDKTTGDLLRVVNGRRNLIRTLQKLCFDQRTFHQGAKLMIKFALAENEGWANNATGEVLTLFHVYLPGTEANLKSRIEIMRWMRTLENSTDLLIGVLSSALLSGDYTYFSGAEKQGINRLEHYYPTPAEILQYWDEVVSIIKDVTESEVEKLEIIAKASASRFTGLIHCGASEIAFDLVSFIAEKRKWDWDEMKEIVRKMLMQKRTREYPESVKRRLAELQVKLTKTDFISRLRDISLSAGGNWREELERKAARYAEMAIEFVEKEGASCSLLKQIILDENLKPYSVFGKTLYLHVLEDKKKYQDIANTLIESVKETQDFTNEILIGFFTNANEDDYLEVYSEILRQIPGALFPLYAARKVALKDCAILFELVSSGTVPAGAFCRFCVDYPWHVIEVEEEIGFYNKLVSLSNEGALLAFERLNMRLIFDSEGSNRAADYVIGCKDIVLKSSTPVMIDSEPYMDLIETLLKSYDNSDIASFISGKLVSYFLLDSTHSHDVPYFVEAVLAIIFDKYFEIIWPDWAKPLADPNNYVQAYFLRYELGSSIGGINDGVLFRNDHSESLKKWCLDYPDNAPIILANYVPVYEGNSFSPLFVFLLDEFGSNKSVLDALTCNLGSFFCSGSLVPVYEQKKQALQELIPHKNPLVQQWLTENVERAEAEIARETELDAEDMIRYR